MWITKTIVNNLKTKRLSIVIWEYELVQTATEPKSEEEN